MTEPADDIFSASVMMSVPTPEALRQSEILVLRQLGDAITRLDGTMQTSLRELREEVRANGDSVSDVRERLIRIESRDTEAKLTELRADLRERIDKNFHHTEVNCQRLDRLETERNKRTALGGIGDIVLRLAPWVAVGIGIVGLLLKHG